MRLNGETFQTLFSSALLNGNLQSSRRSVVGVLFPSLRDSWSCPCQFVGDVCPLDSPPILYVFIWPILHTTFLNIRRIDYTSPCNVRVILLKHYIFTGMRGFFACLRRTIFRIFWSDMFPLFTEYCVPATVPLVLPFIGWHSTPPNFQLPLRIKTRNKNPIERKRNRAYEERTRFHFFLLCIFPIGFPLTKKI